MAIEDQPQDTLHSKRTFFERLRANPLSPAEFIIILIVLDFPAKLAHMILMNLGVPDWPAFGLGILASVACLICYLAIRNEPVSRG
jgi:hypothetical protein